MAHFALVQNGIVTDVVVADQDFISTGALGDPANWVQTSYNTYGNVYYIPNSNPREPDPDQSKALRANYAGIGYTYDPNYTLNDVVGVFYAPQPYPSWILNTQTFLWEAPVPYPTDGKVYTWDEATQSWVEVPQG
jgi:hypothetical protein